MEWSVDPLDNAICDRSIDISHICIVPWITQVVCQATSNQLRKVIDPWIEDSEYKNKNVNVILFFSILSLVRSYYIHIHCYNIHDMHHESESMEPSTIGHPLVLYHLLDAAVFKYVNFFSFLEKAY